MSHRILSKKQLSEDVFTAEIEAPLVAQARKPGQFVIISINSQYSERIPLTIADADPEKGTIRLIWQRVGKTTAELADMQVGDEIANVVGPLGKPTHIENFGTIVCVGGGIGNAPLLPIATALKRAGNKVISILGARNKKLLILEAEFAQISDELIITTDDGSYRRKADRAAERSLRARPKTGPRLRNRPGYNDEVLLPGNKAVQYPHASIAQYDYG